MVKPSQRKEMAKQAIKDKKVSIRMACAAFSISQTCYRYKPLLGNENEEIKHWLLLLTETHKRCGFGLRFLYLRNIKGFAWNHQRVYMVYRELELSTH